MRLALTVFALALGFAASVAALAVAWDVAPMQARVIALEGRIEQLEGALDKADARAASYEREYRRLQDKVRRFERSHNAFARR